MKGGDEEIVDAGDGRGLQQQLGLRAAFFAGDQHLGDGGGLGVGEHAVHVAHEVAAQRDEEEHAQAAAREADEDGLHGVGIELQDVERGQGEDGAGHDAAGHAADAGDDDVLKQAGAARDRGARGRWPGSRWGWPLP